VRVLKAKYTKNKKVLEGKTIKEKEIFGSTTSNKTQSISINQKKKKFFL